MKRKRRQDLKPVFALQLQAMCEILGQPEDHLLDAGLKTRQFFMKTHDDKWTFKVAFPPHHHQNINTRSVEACLTFLLCLLDTGRILGKQDCF